LLEVANGHGVDVSSRAKHDELVDALVGARSVSFDEVLAGLSRDELKAICDAHEMDRSGKAKAPIVARILGREPDSSAPKSESLAAATKRKTKKKEKMTGEKNGSGGVLGFEAELFGMADQLWTNSGLQPSEYSTPVLALVFLKYADHKFAQVEAELAAKQRRRRQVSKDDYLARGVLYVPAEARFQTLLELPEGSDLGKAVNDAMKAIEAANPELKDVLPKTFAKFERTTLASLLKIFGSIPPESSGDTFGRIYEYFLGSFAPRTLQKGGEYFTPESVVKLIVEIVEPFHGRILDPACGSGGMFIQSARFVQEHKKNPAEEISVHGIEKISQTLRLTKMNLAVHGLSGDIREANTYYEDPHDCVGKFDFVMANPPFNQSAVDKERIKDDKRRLQFGLPSPDNANWLWVQLFYSALNNSGRAGFVMANSASDARGSEADIRRALIESGAVDVVVNLSSNLFYTVALPATLLFLDRGKTAGSLADRVLFIDARAVFRQVTRAHRELTPAQVEFLANIVRLHRGNACEDRYGGTALVAERLGSQMYCNTDGLCYSATRAEIAEKDWSLNPGRYVGTDLAVEDSGDFDARFDSMVDRLRALGDEARSLETKILRSAEAITKAAQ
jgi:type I restriction enzyme M protein